MKILVVAENIYDKRLYCNKRSITGLAVMVRDIFDGISKLHDCYVLSTSMECPSVSYGKLHIVENNFKGKLRYLTFSIILNAFFMLFSGKGSKIRQYVSKELRARMLLAKFKALYGLIRPDIVNLHDLSDINTLIAHYCCKEGAKVLMTSHLYVGKTGGAYGYNYLKRNEELLYASPSKNFYLSFVSRGMMKRFLTDYPNFPSCRVFCVVNGTKIEKNESTILTKPTVFDKVGDRKVLLCIGTYCKRKNQDQIISAFNCLNKDLKSKLVVMFIGKDDKGVLKSKIDCSTYNDYLIYCGEVSFTDMQSFYKYCDGTITTSLNESFGLTIIEGFAFGKPAILFDDIDSFEDLFDEKTCVGIKEHTDAAVANAIEEYITQKWDSDYIKNTTERFSMERVSREYINIYTDILMTEG